MVLDQLDLWFLGQFNPPADYHTNPINSAKCDRLKGFRNFFTVWRGWNLYCVTDKTEDKKKCSFSSSFSTSTAQVLFYCNFSSYSIDHILKIKYYRCCNLVIKTLSATVYWTQITHKWFIFLCWTFIYCQHIPTRKYLWVGRVSIERNTCFFPTDFKWVTLDMVLLVNGTVYSR